jgi:hypothetical protein
VSSQEPTVSSPKWWATFLGLSTLELLLIYKILTSEASTSLLIFAGFVAFLLFLLLIIDRIAEFTANKEGVSVKVYEQINKKVGQLGEDINDLLFLTILDAYEYITLKKVRGDESDDSYHFSYPKGQDLIERLRNRGLIEEKMNKLIFSSKNERYINVRDHFLITDRGNKYLDELNKKGLGKELESIAKRTIHGR